MKRILTILAVAFAIQASAQDIVPNQEEKPRKSIKEQLQSPAQRDSLTTINQTVTFTEQGDAAAIVEKSLTSAPKSINGYRIVIFMSNTQTARRDAVAVQESFAGWAT